MKALFAIVLMIFFATACGGGEWAPGEGNPELLGRPVFQAVSSDKINISEAVFDEFSGCGLTRDDTRDQLRNAVRLMERGNAPLERINRFGGSTSEGGNVQSSYDVDVTITKASEDMYIIFCSREGGAMPTSTLAPLGAPEGSAISVPTVGGVAELDIDVNGEQLEFSLASISISTDVRVVVNFNNSSSVNSHNWVLVEAGSKDAVAVDGVAAGPANHWLPVDDSRVLASTVLLRPGESATATFTAPAAGTYQFVCTFPGHNFSMFGEFIVN